MEQEMFRALVLDEVDGEVRATVRAVPTTDLPDGDVTVAVAYSDLNYKDGLALMGQARVVRQYPMVPGIDFAGTVIASQSPRWSAGDEVILTGWGVGERHWGGYAEQARVPGDWLVPLPAGLSARDAMSVGTAGLTAMLCILALEDHGLTAESGPVLVTGAGGGVGSVAVALLARGGYHVVASTGRAGLHAYLTTLGAREIRDRAALGPSNRPLESEQWAGVVDTIGGETLAAALRAVRQGGSVAACGNAGGNTLSMTVLPFILRGVNLLGINSVPVPIALREAAWARIAMDLPRDLLGEITEVIGLGDLPAYAPRILAGQVRGRVVVDVRA